METTRRLRVLSIALLYLLAQGGILVHAGEILSSCTGCAHEGVALECSGEDCADPEHHHHDHHHHSTCRTCSSGTLIDSFAVGELPGLSSSGLLVEPPSARPDSAVITAESARAPPGDLRPTK